jgi:polysaccharide pyruvyl transferase WcaK-like protein
MSIDRREKKREGKPLLKEVEGKRKKISFFGNFGSSNLGNEATFQTVLYHLRRRLPTAEITCICTCPETAAATHNVAGISASGVVLKPRWLRGNPLSRLLREIIIGIPSELYRWLDAFRTLKGTHILIVPGTGLLTDAYGLLGWGPYNLFKWSVMARLRGCRVRFVSVGVGPIYSATGRYLVRSALSLADFRSYRDGSSLEWAKQIGLQVNGDRVYPDLVFSLPETDIPRAIRKSGNRSVVGIGLMEYAGRYSVPNPSDKTYRGYLESLVLFVKWALGHKYDVKLLMADHQDRPIAQEFKCLLKTQMPGLDERRIAYEPAECPGQLLSQLAATDVVVATRFHNVLLALLLNKPVIAISFHHKCTSLMSEMGLAEYCHDINHIDADRLIEQFQDVERNAEKLKPVIRQKVEQSRKSLDEQYNVIFKCV